MAFLKSRVIKQKRITDLQFEPISHARLLIHLTCLQLLEWKCVYPEPVDEVIAGEQVVDQELEGVFWGGLMEGEDIKGPLIHLLENRTESFCNRMVSKGLCVSV